MNEGRISVAGTLAADAQEVVIDAALEHPTSSEDYGSGSVEGLRIMVCGAPGTTSFLQPPTIVVLLLNAGDAVPTVNTNATMKSNENEVWMVGKAERTTDALVAGALAPGWTYNAMPRTSRRHQKGDRVVVVVINRDATTWANPHTYSWSVEGYHVES